MKIVYSNNEFKPGTLLRRIYMYDDDGDLIMTNERLYESPPQKMVEVWEPEEEEEYDEEDEDEYE